MGSSELHGLARAIFGDLSRSYDSVLDWMTLLQDRRWKRAMLEKLRLEKEMSILDVGCGTGVLEERLPLAGVDVVGIDLTSSMLRIAHRKNLPAFSLLSVADADHLPFSDCTFDAVLSCYVPKYCDLSAFVEEARRVLRPGGVFIVYDFTKPRGMFAPFHALYIYALMPILGRLTKRTNTGLAFTCNELPKIIRQTRWEEEASALLGGSGFRAPSYAELTGGVVTLFWASKV